MVLVSWAVAQGYELQLSVSRGVWNKANDEPTSELLAYKRRHVQKGGKEEERRLTAVGFAQDS